jgi:hypothetical protein
MKTVKNLKYHVQKHNGILAKDQVWLVGDRDQPLNDDESVRNCITPGSEVHILAELKLHPTMKKLLPEPFANSVNTDEISIMFAPLRIVDVKGLKEALKANTLQFRLLS